MNLSSSEKKNYWKKIQLFEPFLQKILYYNRRKILKIFSKFIKIKKNYTLLDVGASPIVSMSENMFLKKFRHHKKLSCLSNQDLSPIKKKFNNFSYYLGNAKKMHFCDNKFDIVHSNATIEHVGSDKYQIQFIRECLRVSKNKIFISTPYKYFPIDFHSKIPFLHYFPHSFYSYILKLLGENFFRFKKNLNLISYQKIVFYCKKLKIKNYKIVFHRSLFLKSNLILIFNK